MFTQSLKASVFRLSSPVLQSEHTELVDVEFETEANHKTLRLLVYRKNGVSIEDCRFIAKMMQPILSVHELLQDDWNFEVASQGVDRPLSSFDDFRRNHGQLVVVKYFDKGINQRSIGRIEAVTKTTVVLKREGSASKKQQKSPKKSQAKLIEIQIADIQHAQIELVW